MGVVSGFIGTVVVLNLCRRLTDGPLVAQVSLAVLRVMDTGESQFIQDCFSPGDISDGQVPPDATPVIRFESSNEEGGNDIKDEGGISSEPEVCVFLQGLYLITGVTRRYRFQLRTQKYSAECQRGENKPKCFVCLLQGLSNAPRKG